MHPPIAIAATARMVICILFLSNTFISFFNIVSFGDFGARSFYLNFNRIQQDATDDMTMAEVAL